MPNRPSSIPGLIWNTTNNRWELVGKGNRFIQGFSRSGTPLVQTVSFIGSSPAISNVSGSIGANTVGTIDNATGLAVADIVFASPKFMATLGVAFSFRVPAADTLNFSVRGSLPAGGWDVVAFRPGN